MKMVVQAVINFSAVAAAMETVPKLATADIEIQFAMLYEGILIYCVSEQEAIELLRCALQKHAGSLVAPEP